MAHYDIFRHHLAKTFPTYGHALWEPGPGNLYPAVEVGDVGYTHQGRFRRLFNVLLPAEHPSHRNFGVPEYHEQLIPDMDNHIETSELSPQNFYSTGVTLGSESGRWANGGGKVGTASFSCPMNQGAVLCLPTRAKGEDTVASADFGKWIIKHIDYWFAWARQLGLEIDRMEDIILVTGTHRTRSWTNVAFHGGLGDAQASFRANVDHHGDTVSINWQLSHERNRGVVLNCGPNGEDLPEDQCIFIRGFRVARLNPDPEEYDEEPTAELMSIPAVPEYRDPLHVLLEYIAEEAPSNCNMVLIHDSDLARLDGIYNSIPEDGLPSDVVLSHVRSLRPTVHSAQIGEPFQYRDFSTTRSGGANLKDLESARGIASGDPKPIWVATLSNIFERGLSPSPSSALQSLHVEAPLFRRPAPPAPFPQPNAFGTEGSLPRRVPDYSAYTQRPCLSPLPLPSPVLPAYLIGDHVGVRPQVLGSVPHQLRMGHLNRPVRPATLPQARAPGPALANTPPYLPGSLATLGCTDIRNPRYFGLPAPSYRGVPLCLVPSRVLERPHTQMYGSRVLRSPCHPVTPENPVSLYGGSLYESISSYASERPNPYVSRNAYPEQKPQPQPLYDIGHEYLAHRPHVLVSQPYSPSVKQERAVLVGINYSRHRNPRFRPGSGVHDANEIAHFLHRHLGFKGNNIRVLTDNQPESPPTKENILAAMRWLVEGAQPEDSLFFYFSGHATRLKNTNKDKDEQDGFDECICAVDYMGNAQSSLTTPGVIVLDDMYDIMVEPLPLGCRLTAILDCYHSGSLSDLPSIYDAWGAPKPLNTNSNVRQRWDNPDVIFLSACKDSERPFEDHEGGSLGRAFIESMTSCGNRGTYLDVIQSLYTYMNTKDLRKRPRLSSSRPMNINQRFHLTDEHPQGFTTPPPRHQLEENPVSCRAGDTHLADSTHSLVQLLDLGNAEIRGPNFDL
ncbi:caspase domain-containing protein [Lactarius indigo]|nr:caspase domain-containing protein [Lactarius indigo]